MPPPSIYQPTPAQLAILRGLDRATRYLIVRAKPWAPAKAIVPIRSETGLAHHLWQIDQAGEHAQVVSYRPDEEDLGPFEPKPISVLMWLIPLALLWLIVGTLIARVWH